MAKSRKLPEVLTDDEIAAVLSQFNHRSPTSWRNQCMIKVALATGMRVGELAALRWEDLTLEGGAWKVFIHDGKGHKDRILWVRPGLVAELIRMTAKMGREQTGLIFATLDGAPLDTGYLRRTLRAKGVKAGVPRLHWHLLRHTALTKLYARTKDLRLVQEVAGHANVQTSTIYTHLSGAGIRSALLAD
jgi:integrase/recombinase XerD